MRLQVYHSPNKNEIRALMKQFFNIITTRPQPQTKNWTHQQREISNKQSNRTKLRANSFKEHCWMSTEVLRKVTSGPRKIRFF